jgi:hypothetical protein
MYKPIEFLIGPEINASGQMDMASITVFKPCNF